MNDEKFDNFLWAYQSETDKAPSRQLIENILSVSGRSGPQAVRPWHWFDLMLPKAIGWALTCCLGIYIGLSSPEAVNNSVDEEYFLYGQAQILLSEDMSQDLSREVVD